MATTLAGPRLIHAHSAAKLRVAYGLSATLSVVATVATAGGFFIPGIFHDPAVMTGSARGVDLITLTITIPVLLGAMLLAARGWWWAPLVWLGALGNLLYWGVYFAFDATFNRLFLPHVALFGLALWALVALVPHVGPGKRGDTTAPRWAARTVAVFLLYPAILPALGDLRQIVSATVADTIPASVVGTQLPASPFQVLGLAVVYPLALLAAVGLWRHRAWGVTLGGTLLTYWALATASIAGDQWFAHRADPNSPLASALGTPLFAAQALITLVVLIAFLHRVQPSPSPVGEWTDVGA